MITVTQRELGDDFVDVATAARIIGCHRSTIHRWIRADRLPAHHWLRPNVFLLRRADVKALAAARTGAVHADDHVSVRRSASARAPPARTTAAFVPVPGRRLTGGVVCGQMGEVHHNTARFARC